MGSNEFLTTKQLELQPAIKDQISEMASNIIDVLYVLVDPATLSSQENETFQRLVYNFINKLMQRNIGTLINLTRGHAQV